MKIFTRSDFKQRFQMEEASVLLFLTHLAGLTLQVNAQSATNGRGLQNYWTPKYVNIAGIENNVDFINCRKQSSQTIKAIF